MGKVPGGMCVLDHEDFKILTHKVALEANLKSVWNAGINDTANQDISNVNLRYAAYRSLFGWLCKGKQRKSLRSSLPSCVVSKVREMYPDPDAIYTGFRQ